VVVLRLRDEVDCVLPEGSDPDGDTHNKLEYTRFV